MSAVSNFVERFKEMMDPRSLELLQVLPMLQCVSIILQFNLYLKSRFKSKSFAGTPVRLNVLLHVLEVVLELLDPVRSSCRCDRQLVSVVPDNNGQ